MSEPGMSVRNLPRGNLLKLPQELGLICCVAMGDFDPELYTQLGLLLSDKAPVIDNLVQEAALKSTTVLVQRFVVNCRMAFTTAYPSDSFPEFGGGGIGPPSAPFCYLTFTNIRVCVQYGEASSAAIDSCSKVFFIMYQGESGDAW